MKKHVILNYDGATKKQTFDVKYIEQENGQYLLCQAGQWRFGGVAGEFTTSGDAARRILRFWN